MLTNVNEDSVEIDDGEVVFVRDHSNPAWRVAENKDFILAHAIENVYVALQACAFHSLDFQAVCDKARADLLEATTPVFDVPTPKEMLDNGQ